MSAAWALPRQRARAELIRLPRDVDLAATPAVRELLTPTIRGHRQSVVVDLPRVSSMDCAGLGVLLELNHHLGGRLRLLDCPPFVCDLMRVTGTYDMFDRLS